MMVSPLCCGCFQYILKEVTIQPLKLQFFGGDFVEHTLEMAGGFSIQTVGVDLPCKAHSHDFLELAYIKTGWTLHTLNHNCRRLTAGDFMLVDFGETHSYDEGSSDLTVINCLFQPAMVDPALGHCRRFSLLLDSCVPGMGFAGVSLGNKLLHDDSGNILSILERLEEEVRQQAVGYLPMLRILLMDLTIQIIRQMGMQASCRPGVEVGWILEEINHNAAAPHSLSQYAHRFQMRPEALSRMFRHQVGEGFACYLRRKRMEMACRLLLDTDQSVPQVAESCGYFDVKAFREAFHQITGISPREYRSRNRIPAIRSPILRLG